jgi:hypothetical protein
LERKNVCFGFATSFIITITLSAADATAHILENPFVHGNLPFLKHPVIVTLILIGFLGVIFLRGFKEAIGIAVFIVAFYILLNLIVVSKGIAVLIQHPEYFANWRNLLFESYANPIAIIAASLIVFPKLALGLSGFETGVVVMPLVKGEENDDPENPLGRIKNTRKLLTTAALIMSVLLISSSIITTLLIPADAFLPPLNGKEAGEAYGRALAFLAHEMFGDVFGTFYDISTIMILWFAGSSAMAGLLNIVPRYLPRYGMAPDWAKATRPLTLVFTGICFLVTVLFQADVNAQGGAYATGVLALMTSAAIAVTLSVKREGSKKWWGFLLISIVFIFTTSVNIWEQPEGIKIASLFILGIVLASFFSRALRSTEIRIDDIEFDQKAQEFINEMCEGEIRIVTNRREVGDVAEYRFKEHEKRVDNHIPASDPIVFYEIQLGDASEFKGKLKIRGYDIEGYRVLRTEAPAVPNAIAGILIYLRDKTGKIPHVYFGWSEGNPIMYLIRYIFFGEGDTAPVTREILRQAEEDPERRPSVHVGG